MSLLFLFWRVVDFNYAICFLIEYVYVLMTIIVIIVILCLCLDLDLIVSPDGRIYIMIIIAIQ